MTQRRCHTLKGNKGTEAASSWVFVDTESWPDASQGAGQVIRHKLRLGSAYAVRLEGGRRRSERWCDFKEPDVFWQFVWERLSDHRPTWLVAHNLSFDFPLLAGFRLLERYGLKSWKLVLGPPTTVIRGKPDGRSLVIVDGLNYFRTSIDTLGRWLSLPKGTMPAFTAPDSVWWEYCRRDVSILAEAMIALVQFHRDRDLGVVGKTAAQCAMHAFRHKHRERAIYFHDDEEVLGWERAAYYGGRVECNFVGEYQGPVFQLDVNSLYPSVMRDTPLPCRLVGRYDAPAVKWLRERCGEYDGVARVVLDTAADTYPFRPADARRSPWWTAKCLDMMPEQAWTGRTLYPRGVYPTWLCGAELAQALSRGHVLEVKVAALYERAVLFKSWVDWWYGYRLDSRRRGAGLGEYVAKTYMNSLAGIWAKRAPKWVTAEDEIPPHPWARWTMRDTIEDRTRVFRAIGNVPQEEVEDGEPFDSFPAISACVNAAARCRMREVQEAAGPRGWLYEDTDGIILTLAGFDGACLAGKTGRDRLGALRLEVEAAGAVIRGVKDYELGGKLVLKGARRDAEWSDPHTCTQWEWHRLKWCQRNRGADVATQQLRQLHFHRGYLKGAVCKDGWTEPYNLMLHPLLDW